MEISKMPISCVSHGHLFTFFSAAFVSALKTFSTVPICLDLNISYLIQLWNFCEWDFFVTSHVILFFLKACKYSAWPLMRFAYILLYTTRRHVRSAYNFASEKETTYLLWRAHNKILKLPWIWEGCAYYVPSTYTDYVRFYAFRVNFSNYATSDIL